MHDSVRIQQKEQKMDCWHVQKAVLPTSVFICQLYLSRAISSVLFADKLHGAAPPVLWFKRGDRYFRDSLYLGNTSAFYRQNEFESLRKR